MILSICAIIGSASRSCDSGPSTSPASGSADACGSTGCISSCSLSFFVFFGDTKFLDLDSLIDSMIKPLIIFLRSFLVICLYKYIKLK